MNELKSAVARPQEGKFLGFSFTDGPVVRRVIAPKALDRFKRRVREITRRARGVSIETTMAELAPHMRRWRSYFLSQIRRSAQADGGVACNQIRQRQAIISLDIPEELGMTLGQTGPENTVVVELCLAQSEPPDSKFTTGNRAFSGHRFGKRQPSRAQEACEAFWNPVQ